MKNPELNDFQENKNNEKDVSNNLNPLIDDSIEKDYFFLIKTLFNEKYTKELKEEIDNYTNKILLHQSYILQVQTLFKIINDFPDEKYIEEIEKYDKDNDFIIQLDFNKISENILFKFLTKQYKYDLLYLGVIYSIPYAEINYFKKIIKLIIEECNKEEKKKKI